jgi:type II secretory pathway component GspD/PulD (secretin)
LTRPRGRSRFAAIALALAVGFVASGGLASPAPPHAAAVKVRLVARDEPVRDVFLRLSDLAHISITVADDVHGTVNLSLHDATPGQAVHAICSQLRLRCVSDGHTILVSSQSSAVVPLTIVSAARTAKILRGLFPRLSVAEADSGNALVLSGADSDINAARTVVQGLDVRDATKPVTEAVAVRTQPAAAVAEQLRKLYPGAKITAVSRSTMLVSANALDLAQIKGAVAGIDGSVPQPTIAPVASDAVKITQRRPRDIARGLSAEVPHVRVGVSGPTVTLVGPPEDVARAKALIAELDVPPFGSRYTQIYRLKNVDAKSVADLIKRAFPQTDVSVDASLNALSVTASAVDQQRIAEGVAQLDGTATAGANGLGGIEGGAPGAAPSNHEIVQLRSIVPGTQGTGTSSQDLATAVQQALAQAHPELHVVVPSGMQAIILTGSAQAVRDAKDLIAELDVVPQSVVLDTEILELDESTSRNLGLELGTTSIGTTFTEVVPPNDASGNPGRLGNLQALTRTPISFQAQINLLLQNGSARVLADPRITTLSGHTATIRAGDTISILTTVGGGTGTVATTQLESFQTGVTLDITPIITDAGELSVALHPVVNSLTGYLNGVPQISTRDTQTTVHLHDNQTLVIGGLIQESSQRTESKIPFFGDIPLIGKAFRNENTTSTRNELIIVVTPHVLGNELATVPNAAIPPGAVVPTARPLPTLPPGATFPVPPAATPRPRSTPTPATVARAASAPPTSPPGTSPSPAALPSAFAQANTFVFGSPPPSNYAGPGDAPQIYYATLTPTVFQPNSTVRINAITTTNVQRISIGTGSASISLSPVGPGTWSGVFSANVLGLPPTSGSLHLTLTASRGDGQTASIPITVSVMHGASTDNVTL